MKNCEFYILKLTMKIEELIIFGKQPNLLSFFLQLNPFNQLIYKLQQSNMSHGQRRSRILWSEKINVWAGLFADFKWPHNSPIFDEYQTQSA